MPSQSSDLHIDYYGTGLKWAKDPIIGKFVKICGVPCFFDCQDQITIGDYSFLAHGVRILTGYHDYTKFDLERQDAIKTAPVTIGRGVWIASFVTILPGVTIGDHAVVGAGSVVTKNIGPYELWMGNPATFKRLIDPALREKAENEAWKSFNLKENL